MKLTMRSVRVTQQIRTNGPTLGEEEGEEELYDSKTRSELM